MTIRAAMYSHLTGTSVITNTLDNSSAVFYEGTYPDLLPAKYIGIQQIDKQTTSHLTGGGGIARTRFQLNCWADSLEACTLITEALRKELHAFRGELGFDTSAVFANEIRLDDDNEETIAPIDASQTGKFGRRMDFLVWHSETVTVT